MARPANQERHAESLLKRMDRRNRLVVLPPDANTSAFARRGREPHQSKRSDFRNRGRQVANFAQPLPHHRRPQLPWSGPRSLDLKSGAVTLVTFGSPRARHPSLRPGVNWLPDGMTLGA